MRAALFVAPSKVTATCCQTLFGAATFAINVVAVPAVLRTTNRYLPAVPRALQSRSYCSKPPPVPLAINEPPEIWEFRNLTHIEIVKVRPLVKFRAASSANRIYWL